MNPIVSAALISGGTNILGDLLDWNRGSNDSSQNASMAWTIEENRKNYERQKEFAKNGLRWRVEDAIAAGLHPLAALGASGASYSPASIAPLFGTDDEGLSKGQFLARSGQNIARAVEATMSKEERLFNAQRNQLEIERMKKENLLLDMQITKVGQATGPGFPNYTGISMTGQADSGARATGGPLELLPMGRTFSPYARPAQAYGDASFYTFEKMPDGSLAVTPSPDVVGVNSNDILEWAKWHWRDIIFRNFSPELMSPSEQDHPLPEGLHWEYRPLTGRYHPTKNRW